MKEIIARLSQQIFPDGETVVIIPEKMCLPSIMLSLKRQGIKHQLYERRAERGSGRSSNA